MTRELSMVSASGGDQGSTASMPRRANAAHNLNRTGPSSLFILSENNILRRMTKFLIEWPPFEYTVLVFETYFESEHSFIANMNSG